MTCGGRASAGGGAQHVGLLAGLSGWLAAEGVTASGLSSEVAERLRGAARGRHDPLTVKALGPLLGYCAGGRRAAAEPPAGGASGGALSRLSGSGAERGLLPVPRAGSRQGRPFVERFESRTG